VFGVPLNRLAPALSGCSRSSDFHIVIISFTNAAGLSECGNKIDQKAAEGHSGTTKVPLVPQLHALGLSLLCSKFHLLCFLAFLQFSAHYTRFYVSLDCIMLALLYAESSWIDVTEQDLCI